MCGVEPHVCPKNLSQFCNGLLDCACSQVSCIRSWKLASAKAPMIVVLWSGVSDLSQTSFSNPMHFVHSTQWFQALCSFSLIPFVTPISLFISAATMSAMRVSLAAVRRRWKMAAPVGGSTIWLRRLIWDEKGRIFAILNQQLYLKRQQYAGCISNNQREVGPLHIFGPLNVTACVTSWRRMCYHIKLKNRPLLAHFYSKLPPTLSVRLLQTPVNCFGVGMQSRLPLTTEIAMRCRKYHNHPFPGAGVRQTDDWRPLVANQI